MPPTFLSPVPITDDYVSSLRADLDGARILRFAMAYVSTSGLGTIGIDLLSTALRQEHSLGVASLACACGFEPLMTLQQQIERDEPNLRYFLDPGIADIGDLNVALLHSKLVYIVREDGQAVVYLGSHNWSGRALGGSSTRNSEASFRIEVDFDEAHLRGEGTGLGAEVNKHILASYGLGACLPVTADNEPVFEDWFRVRCQRPTDLELDSYAVVVGICSDSVTNARDPAFWTSGARGAGIYVQCHEEEEGHVLRKRQERVLVMAWADQAAFAQAKPPVLLFCKVTHQRAGKDSVLEGTAVADLANFGFLLWDHRQNDARGADEPTGPRLQATTRTGQPFDYFALDATPAAAMASTYDKAQPHYQHYLQVYEVVLPAWMVLESEDPEADPTHLVWNPEEFALSPSRKVPPEEQRLYRAPNAAAERIMECLRDQFGLDIEQAVALPTSEETDPKTLVRLVSTGIHDACIDEATEARQDEFYASATAGTIAMRLRNEEAGTMTQEGSEPVPRVQELFGERLRHLLQRLGVEHPDVEEWERRPKSKRKGDVAPRKKRLQDQADITTKPDPKKVDGAPVSVLSQSELVAALQGAIRKVMKAGAVDRPREEVRAAIIGETCERLGRPDDIALRRRVAELLSATERRR